VVGVDCPLGWPDEFVSFLVEHHDGHVVAPQDVAGKAWRRRLAYRATDRAVQAACGVTPLSVAADRIGLTAMRAAGLLARLADQGRPVDRAGGGVVVEVYPAASLKIWGLPYRSYKGKDGRAGRDALMKALTSAAPWLDLGGHADLCRASDDALDSVIAAMTARATALGLTSRPHPRDADRARREGWIALPTRGLDLLVDA
jgi:predicted nuclease with RNAse H fold